MDPRIAARRAAVSRASQRSSLQSLGRWLALAGAAAAVVWYATSPFVDIDRIAIGGVDEAEVETVLAELGVERGDPLLTVPAGRLEEELLADPWVSSANVSRVLPGTLEISVVERVPVLVVESAGVDVIVAQDGTVLETAVDAPEHLPVLVDGPRQPSAGYAVAGTSAEAALVFLSEYGPVSAPARFELLEGELWLRLPDHDVRLGRPVEMAAKAASLRAVLADGPPMGTVIVMIAPERPTLQQPADPVAPEAQPEVEG